MVGYRCRHAQIAQLDSAICRAAQQHVPRLDVAVEYVLVDVKMFQPVHHRTHHHGDLILGQRRLGYAEHISDRSVAQLHRNPQRPCLAQAAIILDDMRRVALAEHPYLLLDVGSE